MFFNTFFFFQIFHRVLQHKNRAITHFFTRFCFMKPMLSPPKTHAFTTWSPAFHRAKPMVSRNATNGFSFLIPLYIFLITIMHSHTSRYKRSAPNARIFAYLRPLDFYFQTWPFYSITILTIKDGLSHHLLNNVKMYDTFFYALQKKWAKNKKITALLIRIATIIKKAKQQSISFFYTNFAQSYPTPPHWARQQR